MANKEDSRKFRNALGAFPTGVTVVTTTDTNGDPIGFTANSFTSVSMAPRKILICIDKASINLNVFEDGSAFAVNVLAEYQQQVSTTFATQVDDRFSNIDWTLSDLGCPLISESAAWFDCLKEKCIDAGDHIILLGSVEGFHSSTYTPLVYLRGNYVNLGLHMKMLKTMESSASNVIVGLIIEYRKKIFLLEDNTSNNLYLPTSSRLGSVDDEGSLLSNLIELGISAPEHYLFSVYENQSDKSSLIYYRARIELEPDVNEGKFYEFNDIPLDKISDDAIRTMLERYITERDLNAFGIYVGKEDVGKLELNNKITKIDSKEN